MNILYPWIYINTYVIQGVYMYMYTAFSFSSHTREYVVEVLHDASSADIAKNVELNYVLPPYVEFEQEMDNPDNLQGVGGYPKAFQVL